MAISVVKATKAVTTSGSTVTMTALTATAGSALIVGYGGSPSGGTPSVTRTGDTYTNDTTGNDATTPATDTIASAPNVSTGANNLVATVSGGTLGLSAFAVEVAGLPTSGIRDATSPAIKTGNNTAPTSNALSNATADAIYFAFAADGSGANPATVTAGSGWTQVSGAVTTTELNGAAGQVAGMEWQIVSTVSSRTATWTIDTNPWGALIAVYKASGGAAAVPTITAPTLGPRPGLTRPYQPLLREPAHDSVSAPTVVTTQADTNFLLRANPRIGPRGRVFNSAAMDPATAAAIIDQLDTVSRPNPRLGPRGKALNTDATDTASAPITSSDLEQTDFVLKANPRLGARGRTVNPNATDVVSAITATSAFEETSSYLRPRDRQPYGARASRLLWGGANDLPASSSAAQNMIFILPRGVWAQHITDRIYKEL